MTETTRRELCPNRERCGHTGHYLDEVGKARRCECLQTEIAKNTLGTMYTDRVLDTTPLEQETNTDLRIEGPLALVKRHTARVLLNLATVGKTWRAMDAYRLIEIFLDQDQEFETLAATTEPDLFVLLLGFGDPRNKYLPELIVQLLARRELSIRPTWVIMGLPLEQTGAKYNSDVQARLTKMKRVAIR